LPEWLDQRALAKRIGRTTRQLQTLVAKGLPVDPRRRGPRYDWNVVRPWWEEYLQDQVRQAAPTDEGEARTRKLAAEAALAEYKLAEQQGQMLSLEDHDRILTRILDRLRPKLMNFPGKWAPQVVNLRTIGEGQLRLEEIMCELMAELVLVGDDIEDDLETYSPQETGETDGTTKGEDGSGRTAGGAPAGHRKRPRDLRSRKRHANPGDRPQPRARRRRADRPGPGAAGRGAAGAPEGRT
jgi:phage terminase Nu1 subunit (DNA packaging protein)